MTVWGFELRTLGCKANTLSILPSEQPNCLRIYLRSRRLAVRIPTKSIFFFDKTALMNPYLLSKPDKFVL